MLVIDEVSDFGIERFEEFDRSARVARVFTRQRMPTDYDDHLLRRKKPQPNPKS